jgi:hypothetical protein
MPIFRTAKLSLFKEDRARDIEAFAEKAMAFMSKDFPSIECFGDLVTKGGDTWLELRSQPWVYESSPLMINGGNLDFIAACLDEGGSIRAIWNQVNFIDNVQFQGDIAAHGLHGIHFRMDVASEADRIAYTCRLANSMLGDTFMSLRRISPLNSLSARTEGIRPAIYSFMGSVAMDFPMYEKLSRDEISALVSLDYRGRLDAEDEAFFSASVLQLLELKTDVSEMSSRELGYAIEMALIPLVYNFGYKLMASGADVRTTMQEADRRIEVLLGFLPASNDFKAALTRQIQINLFSAFPEGLKLLQAKPEELQGVILNSVLVDDPAAKDFSATLSGPVALFSQRTQKRAEYRSGKLIEFLADAGYPIHLDVAINGYLAREHDIANLLIGHSGWSPALDQAFQETGHIGSVNKVLSVPLFEPDVLRLYSDKAVLNMIDHAIKSEIKGRRSDKPRFPIAPAISPFRYKSPAPVLRERPHLFEPVLQILENLDCFEPSIVEWCGFSHRELKAMGSRAPSQLKKVLLENSLGL